MPNKFSDPDEVRALRDKLGMTQRELGVLVFDYPEDHARSALAKIEQGRRAANGAARKMLSRIEAEMLSNDKEL
jgi:DNA-binding transcriptional regulator YiaG